MAVTSPSVYPEAASVQDGRLLIGGCDAAELAREFGTPPTSWRRTTCAPARGSSAARWPPTTTAPARSIFASKACPVHRGPARVRGGGAGLSTWPRAVSCTWRSRPGSSPPGCTCTATRRREDELAAAIEAGVGTVVVDNLDDVDKLARVLPAGARQAVLLRVRPGIDADTHAAILTGHAESKFGLDPREARAPIDDPPAHLDVRGLPLPPRLAAQRPRRPTAPRSRRSPRSGDFAVYEPRRRVAVAYTRRRPAAARSTRRSRAVVEAAHELLGPGSELVLEPGRALVANAGVTLYTVESVKDVDCRAARGSSPSTAACPTTCARCSTTPPTRPSVADRFGAAGSPATVVGKHCESGDVLIRETRAARAASPATCSSRRSPAPTGTRWPTTTTASRGPPVVFCTDGDARAGRAPRDLRGPGARDV